jgi:kumamolisin
MKTNRSVGKVGLALAFLAATAVGLQLAVAQQERKVFSDSVTPLPKEPGRTAAGLLVHEATIDHSNDKMELLFSLAIPQQAREEMEARVAKGEVISAKELAAKYTPKAADRDKLVAWLQEQGFAIVKKTPDRTGVYASATLGKIEKSLQVQFVRVTRDGLAYNAARTAPSLPADVGAGVRAIIGLQPYRHANRHSRKRPTAKRPGLARNIANAPPYLVPEVLKAYNADNLGVTGAGQKIAILIDTVPLDSDLQLFWKMNSLAVDLKQVEKINVKKVDLPDPEGEETLDVQWSSGIAPGAIVKIYATSSLAFVDLDLALDQLIADAGNDPELRQLSISLGLGETFMGGPEGEVAVQHQKFLTLAALGVNVFVSSGDAGSNPDDTGHSSAGPLQAEFESSDPFVIGVGGTILTLEAGAGAVMSETAWPSSGGGKSIFFKRPPWQVGDGVPTGTERLVPDVSLAAAPEQGALIVLNGKALQIGGTSWSAPTWAGFCALMNEARAKAGKPSLPFLNPLLYPLRKDCFRDITAGNNGAFTAGPGYDLVTGLGVPDVRALIKTLAN